VTERASEAADAAAADGGVLGVARAARSAFDALPAAPDLSALSKLKEKNLAAAGLMILEGRIVIEKALETGVVPQLLVCTEAEAEYWRAKQAAADREAVGAGTGAAAAIAYDPAPAIASAAPAAAGPTFPLHTLSHAELCALVDFKFHRGAIAVADMPRIEIFAAIGSDGRAELGQPAASLHARRSDGVNAPPRGARYLCLWDVTDPSNLGALVRTAAGLGADGVLLGPGCASPYYRKTIRASMGNVFSIPLWSIDAGGLVAFRSEGARVVAAALTENSVPAHGFAATVDARAPLVLVLGNEGYGLPGELLSLCTQQVCIPMARGVDSLNVAVAGGILMYELLGGATA